MRKIALAGLALLLMCRPGYCDSPVLKVEVTPAQPEIAIGESGFPAKVTITNFSTGGVQFPDLSYQASGMSPAYIYYLFLDNPKGSIHLDTVTGTDGPVPMTTLMPGQSLSKNFTVNVDPRDQSGTPLTYRMGFRLAADETPVWSEPFTIKFKQEEELPVTVEASLNDRTIVTGKATRVHVLVINNSKAPQIIGSLDSCGLLHELSDLSSDNLSIAVDSGHSECTATAGGLPGQSAPAAQVSQDKDYDITRNGVMLKPGKVFEQDCRIIPEPGAEATPVTFHVVLKSAGHNPVLSNPLTVTVAAASKDGK